MNNMKIAILFLIAALCVLTATACGNHTRIHLDEFSYERGEEFVHLTMTIKCWELGNTDRLTCENPCATAAFYRDLDDEQDNDDQTDGDESDDDSNDDESNEEDRHQPRDGRITSDNPVSPDEELVDSVTECAEAVMTDGDTVDIELRSSEPIPENDGVKLRVFPAPDHAVAYKDIDDFE